MARARFQTLTEQMFYTLLCLKEECCGIDILDRVPAMTGGRVSIGSLGYIFRNKLIGGRDCGISLTSHPSFYP